MNAPTAFCSAARLRRVSAAIVMVSALFGAVRLSPAGAVTYLVHPSLEQLDVRHATAGATVELIDTGDVVVADGVIDDVGTYLFRDVVPGTYRVRIDGSTSDPVEVRALAGSTPSQAFYDSQDLVAGYQYLTTRDGTRLAANIYLPGPIDKGPYPTVVEYSGYDPARPATPLADNLGLDQATRDLICPVMAVVCTTPSQPGSELALSMGFAVVAVNARGTGCSGGAFDYLEKLQRLDGYDIIETVAAQSWVLGKRVGMVGLSYPGISQVFVAPEQPPHLAAIAPMSVFDDTASGILAPGGIFNEGFALEWIEQVRDRARAYGQGWEQSRVDAGDTQCAENQELRGHNFDSVALAKSQTYYDPAIADPYNPRTFVNRINVPVFMTGAWQDEQTGGHWPHLVAEMTGAPVHKYWGFNGAHADGYSPEVLMDWKAFLDLYVAHRTPQPVPDLLRGFGPDLFRDTFGTNLNFPAESWSTYPSYAAAKAAFEATPDFKVVFERGRGDPPGAAEGGLAAAFDTFPVPGTIAERWYLHPDGSLRPAKPDATAGASRFTFDASQGSRTSFTGNLGDLFKPTPAYEWSAEAADRAVVYTTPPLDTTHTYVGSGSVDLRMKSSMEDALLEVTLSEIRPDGSEMFIQNGWQRALLRKPGPGSSALWPKQTGLESDAAPLVPDEWTTVRIEIFPFAQIVRAGSRLRLSVHSPGGNMSRWSFIVDPDYDGSVITVGHNSVELSSVALPLVSGVSGFDPTPPACPSVRGQPCRTMTAFTNTVAEEAVFPPTTTTTTTTTTPTTTTVPTTVVPTSAGPTTTTPPQPPADPKPMRPRYTG